MPTSLTAPAPAPTAAAATVAGSPACFHCGLPVPAGGRWRVRLDGAEREMCCAGCQAVAQAIVDAGLDDYYRHRTEPAAGPSAVPPELEALALYDEPDVQSRFVRGDAASAETTLMLEGLRCGACVWLIERTLAAQPGVTAASVNFATERAVLRWDPSRTRLSTLLARVGAIGYRAMPYDAQQREAQLARTTRSLFRRMFVAGIGMMQVMMYAVPVYTAAPGDIEWQYEQLMRWASLLLTIPVILYSAQPFFAGALRDLRARSLGMDVPVALGMGAAFAASAWATVTGKGEVYFDSVTMFAFLLLAARYLEWIARRRASRAVDAMAAALPERVARLVGVGAHPDEGQLAAAEAEAVPAIRVEPGDLLRVATGDRIAVDGVILAGTTSIDQSLLTGESIPVLRRPGDEVPGGAINAGNPFYLRVLRRSADSTLSTIERLIERAAIEKPAIALAADRVAGWFVLCLLLFASAVFAAWWFTDPERALPVAIAVLVVSCPCALSLATPAALAAATGAATRHGALVASGRALETMAAATDVVFDKTGTLTEGRPRLARLQTWDGLDRGQALSLAAALEAGSPHPLARALVEAAGATDGRAAATGIEQHPGLGVEADIGGRRLRLGSRSFVAQWTPLPVDAGAGGSEVWLAARTGVLARFELRDELRADAAQTVTRLAADGLRVHLLSGDHTHAVAAVAEALGVTRVRAGASPSDKLDYVRALQRDGGRVLMVGDGINDAPVLAAADVSIAVGQATALARTSADAVLLSPNLDMVPRLLGLARRTRRVVLQNLGWATAYNLTAIPAAALGYVPPWLAAVGMSASSLLVVGNALRLRLGAPGARR
ncbi:heavy metal translocating P-type ATPase [Quisquiliibacterium transsilvanicum]|uniref:Cu2+-exporting ATPase n=1 Tax=Quisquiliibacterium transsilvanicum TaxID=1549638 RepID=A0A7W8HGV0_9BURK|nr:heavy metal translocating P-type ATPase [Quisquiliibacterium transsilvanicum]MBB5271824.1 Cu2+-exporting ATPase [Quisquiliibacterium transsilvanicum]